MFRRSGQGQGIHVAASGLVSCSSLVLSGIGIDADRFGVESKDVRCRSTGKATAFRSSVVAWQRRWSSARGLGRQEQGDRCSRSRAPLHHVIEPRGKRVFFGARGADEIDGGVVNVVGDHYTAYERLHQMQVIRRQHNARDEVVVGRLAAGDFELLRAGVEIADANLEQEAVELGLGQRIRAFRLDRVLRRQDKERIGELLAADGELPFLHGFEERFAFWAACG